MKCILFTRNKLSSKIIFFKKWKRSLRKKRVIHYIYNFVLLHSIKYWCCLCLLVPMLARLLILMLIVWLLILFESRSMLIRWPEDNYFTKKNIYGFDIHIFVVLFIKMMYCNTFIDVLKYIWLYILYTQ